MLSLVAAPGPVPKAKAEAAMNFDEAREATLELLRRQGKAKDWQILEMLDGDENLLKKVRGDLIFEDLAKDKDGVGLVYINPAGESEVVGEAGGEPATAIQPPPPGPAQGPPSPSAVPPKSASDQATPAGTPPPQRGQVFISYGRADAKPLADRLSVDLVAQGYKVWQDMHQIRARHPWHREIEDGLRSSQIVVALLSPHSVRSKADAEAPAETDSVCLDEISYAQYELRLPIVPVMAAPCSPPLFIHRLDYVDLCAWTHSDDQYQVGLRRLLESLDDARRGRVRYRSWEHDLKPWDFAPFLSQKRRDFCGREWLFDELDAWRTSSAEPALLITGDPGTGKSAIVARLLHLNRGSQVLAYHCCQADTPATLEPWRFVRSLAAMIASQLDGYAAQLDDPSIKEHLNESACREDPATSFEQGILTPLESLYAPEDGARYLLVDALDEALAKQTPGLTIVDLLATRLGRMPGWLRVVATTRKEPEVLDRLGGLRARELDTQDEQNLQDVRQYVRQRMESPNLAAALAHRDRTESEVVNVLVDRSEGNFLYVQQALEGVERNQVALADLESLPPGLGALYESFFRRYFPNRESFAPARRVLEVSVAAAEPLTADDLASATGLDPDDELPVLLEQLAVYVPERPGPDGATCFGVFHKSLSDWLTDPKRRGKPYAASASKGHARLAEHCLRQYGRGVEAMTPYALSHLSTHLIGAERWEDLETILTDIFYLEAKTRAGLVFDLARDFSAAVKALPEGRPKRRILKLLEEALRRDLHFISRHARDYPQGFFQSLWNTCWWYDCPEAESHYVEPEGGWTEASARWMQGGVKLHPLLERWRREKEEAVPHFPWLRACRVPLMHLGSVQQAVFRGHDRIATSVAISPAGDRIASASQDKTIRVWDAQSGAELGVLREHEGSVESVVFSPDGERIISGSQDRTVRVWHAQNGAELAVLCGHEDRILSVAISSDGNRIVSGSQDKSVRIWDAESGSQLSILRGHDNWVRSVAISPAGDRIVSGSSDKTVRVWDAKSGAELNVLRNHEGGVRSVAISPAGDRVVSGSHDKTVRVWDLQSGTELAVLHGHQYRVLNVAFAPGGDRIVSCADDNTVRVWDARDGTLLAILRGHEKCVNSVAFFPDGSRIASASNDNTIRVWDTRSGTELDTVRGHEWAIESVSFSTGGDYIVTSSYDTTVRVWDARSGVELKVLRGHKDGAMAATFFPSGDRIVSGARDGTVRVWDVQSGAKLNVLHGHANLVRSVAVSPAEDQIVSGARDGTVRVWDAQSGVQLGVVRGHKRSVRGVAFSPCGNLVAVASADQTVRVWEVANGAEKTVIGEHRDRVTSVAFSPNGDRVASHEQNGPTRVWDVMTGECLEVVEGGVDVEAIAAGPQQFPLQLILRGRETLIRLADRKQPLAWFPVQFTHVATHPDGHTWAGAAGNHLYIFTLEGDPQLAKHNDENEEQPR